MAARRVLFYVQHLLGIGHLKRAVSLVDAMTRAGLEVTLVTGGVPVPGLPVHAAHCIQLPPASAADMSFKTLLDAQGRPVDAHWKQARCEQLLAAWQRTDPQALVIELFPFGRRQMRFELLPLLDAARARAQRPVIVSSVRDVLGGGQADPARQDQMLETFERYFDHVLVHGDAALVPFERTFRHAGRLGPRLHYTGYVVGHPAPAPATAGPLRAQGEVIVSVGGGAVGQQLLEAALQARPSTVLAQQRWRLLAGVNAADADLVRLQELAKGQPGVVVERHRSDFTQLLAACRLSISQGGYNTMMDILQAGAAAVVVPFAGGAEVEQSLRARLLAERGWIELVEASRLDPATLAQAIDRAASRPPAAGISVNLDGARNSAALVAQWIAERAA
jgi:predicted glycosyltransferase